jgi:hypothetical protein
MSTTWTATATASAANSRTGHALVVNREPNWASYETAPRLQTVAV